MKENGKPDDSKNDKDHQETRKINARTYIENNYGTINMQNVADKVRRASDGHLDELISLMPRFLESAEADSLGESEREAIGKEVEIAKKPGDSSRLQRFRNFLSDSANLVTVLTPLTAYIAANGQQLSEWVMSLLK